MNRQDRAKQFMAFDALKGLQEELRKKEVEYEEKKEVSEWIFEELEKEFRKIKIGSKAQVKYYKEGKYITVLGIINYISYEKKEIQVNEEIISLNSIIKIIEE